MRHYLYSIHGMDPDPIRSGSMKSWFLHYKWRLDEDDDVFLPVPEDSFAEAVVGDILWFVLDGALLGCGELLRVFVSDANDWKELWFNPYRCVPARPNIPVPLLVNGTLLNTATVEMLVRSLDLSRAHSPVPGWLLR